MSREHDADLAAEVVRLERENHQLRVELETTRRRALAWRRVAQWIHDAHQPDTEES